MKSLQKLNASYTVPNTGTLNMMVIEKQQQQKKKQFLRNKKHQKNYNIQEKTF